MNKMFVVFDSKADAYHRPFVAQSTGSAIRAFGDEVNNKSDSDLSRHPEDYVLFEMGEWDESSGKLLLLPEKRSLGVGIDFKRN